MGHELDSTLQTFPSYADLLQTKAWARQAEPVRADPSDAVERVELSQSSRYTEGAELGSGGMGKVVLARDGRIGRDVAVKVLPPERELEPHERARFLREAQVQGQLEHPSIVPVYDIDRRADGTTFFTMRRVLGRTLAAIIDDLRKGTPAAKARYTQRELLTAFATVCLTIDYAHSRGVVHRDLKPANIMLGDFGEVYVLDWGLARLVDEKGESKDRPQERLSMPGAFMGTPMYMAPEQMADPDVGPTADVYLLARLDLVRDRAAADRAAAHRHERVPRARAPRHGRRAVPVHRAAAQGADPGADPARRAGLALEAARRPADRPLVTGAGARLATPGGMRVITHPLAPREADDQVGAFMRRLLY
jgi:hypothetical protein